MRPCLRTGLASVCLFGFLVGSTLAQIPGGGIRETIAVPPPGTFLRYLDQLDEVLVQLQEDAAQLGSDDPRLVRSIEVVPEIVRRNRATIAKLRRWTAKNRDHPSVVASDRRISETGLIEVGETYLTAERDPEVMAKFEKGKLAGDGAEVAELGSKGLDLLSPLPVVGAIAELLSTGLSILAQFIEQEVAYTAAQMQIEEKIEQMGDRFGRTLTGDPIRLGPTTEFDPGARSLREDLEALAEGLVMLEAKLDRKEDELERINIKLNNFAALVGQSLNGFVFEIEPSTAPEPEIPSAIKPEIQGLEVKADREEMKIDAIEGKLDILEGKIDQHWNDTPPITPNPTVVVPSLSWDVEHVQPRLVRNATAHVFPAKFVCGENPDSPTAPLDPPESDFKPACYATAINVTNLSGSTLQVTPRYVLSRSLRGNPGGSAQGSPETLAPGESLEIDCVDIRSALGVSFLITGFVYLETPPPGSGSSDDQLLEVVSVYTGMRFPVRVGVTQ